MTQDNAMNNPYTSEEKKAAFWAARRREWAAKDARRAKLKKKLVHWIGNLIVIAGFAWLCWPGRN